MKIMLGPAATESSTVGKAMRNVHAHVAEPGRMEHKEKQSL